MILTLSPWPAVWGALQLSRGSTYLQLWLHHQCLAHSLPGLTIVIIVVNQFDHSSSRGIYSKQYVDNVFFLDAPASLDLTLSISAFFPTQFSLFSLFSLFSQYSQFSQISHNVKVWDILYNSELLSLASLAHHWITFWSFYIMWIYFTELNFAYTVGHCVCQHYNHRQVFFSWSDPYWWGLEPSNVLCHQLQGGKVGRQWFAIILKEIEQKLREAIIRERKDFLWNHFIKWWKKEMILKVVWRVLMGVLRVLQGVWRVFGEKK